jgi:septal ring factor EnvC (AmiA/AmiB activator)
MMTRPSLPFDTENQQIATTAKGRAMRTACLALCITLLATSQAAAQTAATTGPDEAKRELDSRQNELSEAQKKAQALETDVSDLGAERERLNARLVETAALVQRSEAQLTSIEGRMAELEAQEKIVRGSLDQRHGQIATLLGALQRMGRNPPPVLITRREDALKMVRSAMLLSSAFPELKGQALQLTQRLDDLLRVMTDIRSEGQRLQAETDRLNESRTRLANLMEAKKSTIADRQNELIAVRQASAEISKNVEDLSELIGKLDQAVTANVSALGNYQNELKKDPPSPAPDGANPSVVAETASATPPSPDSPDATTTATAVPPAADTGVVTIAPPTATETQVAALSPPKLKPQIVELAPSSTGLILGNPGRIKPAIPFASARAKLPMPAQGRRALAFGERTQYGGQSKGMVLETRNGAQITSPCDGWIVYAGEFRSYGQLLIINAGDGYHILLAGLSQIDVQPGQFVLAAEPVGTMGGVTKSSSTQTGASVLYVEFRKDGRPIDPDPWWVSGQQKVQG